MQIIYPNKKQKTRYHNKVASGFVLIQVLYVLSKLLLRVQFKYL